MSPADGRASHRVPSRFYDLFDLVFLLGGRGNPRPGLVGAIGDDQARILDVCVGTAASAIPVATQLTNGRIVGSDLSDETLAVARGKFGGQGLSGIELVNASAEAMPVDDGAFDTVMVSFALHDVGTT